MLINRLRQITELRFFSRKESIQSAWQVIAWWEIRRVPYNFFVGVAGIVSSVLCLITGVVCDHFLGEPIGIPGSPFGAVILVIIYAVMANVCYTGGWISELIAEKVWPDKGRSFGTISFTLGLFFSILLTLIPGVLIFVTGAIRLIINAF